MIISFLQHTDTWVELFHSATSQHTYLEVKIHLREVLVQRRGQVLSCGHDDTGENMAYVTFQTTEDEGGTQREVIRVHLSGERFLVGFSSVSGLFVEVVWVGDKATGDGRQTYWLVSSLITLQSRGKMVSFIRFRNTQKIFNRNSWWRISQTHFITFSFQSHLIRMWKHA